MPEPALLHKDGVKTHRIDFPAKPGPISADQLSDADRAALAELAQGKKLVIDVGTFLGGSAEALLSGMPEDGRLITVDNYRGVDGSITIQVPRDLMVRYVLERLEPFANQLTVMVGDSRQCAKALPPHSADLVFLDAAHDYENVKADIDAWLPVLKPDGLMTGHDFDRRSGETLTLEEIARRSETDWDHRSGVHCGVIRAVYESFIHVTQPPDMESSIWVAKPEWKRT